MTTEADDIVEERDILSVEALSRELNNAVRFFFACFVAVEPVSPASAALLCSPAARLASGEEDEGVLEDSSSVIACALRERARRSRPLSPPLRMAAEFGRGSISSLSSRDMRFSAVEMPCDSGEGRAGRGVGACSTDEPGCEARVTEEVVEEAEGLR